VKTALLRGRRPTLAPDWIGFLAFRESFELLLGAIPTPTLFLLGARAGTNAKGRFCKARKNLCCGSIEPLSSGEPNVVFRRVSPIAPNPGECLLTEPTPAVRPWSRERVFMPQSAPRQPNQIVSFERNQIL